MNSKIRLGASIGSLLVLLLSFNHCVLQPKATKKPEDGSSSTQTQTNTNTNTNNNNNNNNNNNGNTDPVVEPPSIVLEEVDVGVKNFEQIRETMAVLTGVDPNTNSIRNTNDDLKTQLPTNNDIKTFLPAHQVAVTKLAAEYCDELVDSNNLRGSIWPGFNFGGNPTASLDANGRSNIINQSINFGEWEQLKLPTAMLPKLSFKCSSRTCFLMKPIIQRQQGLWLKAFVSLPWQLQG